MTIATKLRAIPGQTLALFERIAPSIPAFIWSRLKERSTWTGLAMMLTAMGLSVWGKRLDTFADIFLMLTGAGGAMLAGATTKGDGQ